MDGHAVFCYLRGIDDSHSKGEELAGIDMVRCLSKASSRRI